MIEPLNKPIIRVGIAGAGAISQFHLVGWGEVEGIDVVAICDPDEARARERAEAFGIPGVYTDVAEMSCNTFLFPSSSSILRDLK